MKNKYILISDLVLKYKFRYIIGIICLLAVDVLQLVLPRILGFITDLLQAGTLTKQDLAFYSLMIFLIAVGIALFRFLWRYLVFGVAKIIETVLRDRFYIHLQKLSANYYNNHKTGDLMAHATNDIPNIRMAVGQGIVLLIDSIVIPVVAAVMMFNTAGWKLTLASFIPLVILAVVIGLNTKSLHNRIEAMQEAFSDLTEKARENFSGIRVVKSFVQEALEVSKFEKSNSRNRDMNVRFARLMSMLFPFVMSVSSLSFAIALWMGGLQVIRGEITLGTFVAFNGYLGMLVWPVAALGWVVGIFERGSVSMERVQSIMQEDPEIMDKENTLEIFTLKGKIDFRNLTFKYPGTTLPVLRNIDLTLETGRTLAVVGRTGSGKSTLVNLVSRLYEVDEGHLFIDDADITRIPLNTLRGSIGCVPQDTFLFSTTIRDNIDFFLGRDMDSISKVARTAQIYDNILEFPKSFDTIVGERGVTLSGGQKQRVAIARAILREPSILILDDCLSAVDANTEEEILKGLKEVMGNRTTIIVSHRISAIKDADEIIFLEDGEIAERGNHESLLGQRGLYYDLYQKQLMAEQMEVEE